MASAILTVVGTAVGGPLGGLVGGVIGSYIDNTFLFPQDPIQGQRLDGLRPMRTAEGAPMSYARGPRVRIACVPAWYGPDPPIEVAEDVGGGCGGGPQATRYTYYIHMWMDVCQALVGGATTSDWLRRIWANGVKWYDQDNQITITSDQLAIERLAAGTLIVMPDPPYPGAPPTYATSWRMVVRSPNVGPDLSVFRSGFDIDVTGSSEAANNGTWRCEESGKDHTNGESTVTLYNQDVVAVAAGDSITLDQTVDVFDPKYATGVVLYPGGVGQAAPTTVESLVGTGKCSGRPDRARFVIEEFNITEFGNRVANIEVEIEADPTLNLSDLLAEIATNNAISSAWIDATAVTGTVDGVVFQGVHTKLEELQALMLAYDLRVAHRDGGLVFFNRKNATTTVVDADDQAVAAPGAQPPDPLEATDIIGDKLPREVHVAFADTTRDLNVGDGQANYGEGVILSEHLKRVNLPVTLTPNEGTVVATRLLWQELNQRRTANTTLPPSLLGITEGDMLDLDSVGDRMLFQAEHVTRGHDFSVRVEGYRDDQTTASVDGTEVDSDKHPDGGQKIHLPGEPVLHVIDVAPFTDDRVHEPGIYVASSLLDPTEVFTGGAQMERVYPASDYSIMGAWYTEAVSGRCTSLLPARNPAYVDYATSLTVRVRQGTLASVTLTALLESTTINRAAVGVGDKVEIIGFATATLDSITENHRIYTLTTLLRGLRNTEDQTNDHEIGEPFTLLGGGGLDFYPRQVSEQDVSVEYLTVQPGQDISEHLPVQQFARLGTIRPFQVHNTQATRNGSDDVDVTFDRRSRYVFHVFQTGPLDEPTEAYEVDVLDAPDGDVLRTFEVNSSRNFTYTNAQQTTDGLTPGDPVTFAFYQMSAVIGRGKKFEVTL